MREPRVFEDIRYLAADEHVEELRRDAAARREAAAARRVNHTNTREANETHRAVRPEAAHMLAPCADEADRQLGAPA